MLCSGRRFDAADRCNREPIAGDPDNHIPIRRIDRMNRGSRGFRNWMFGLQARSATSRWRLNLRGLRDHNRVTRKDRRRSATTGRRIWPNPRRNGVFDMRW